MPSETNEWEFQGQALVWISQEIKDHPLGFDSATQEFPNKDGKRSDVIIWTSRSNRDAALEVELKRPEVKLNDPDYQKDAINKARRVGSPYVALWNMRELELFRTPAYPRVGFLAEDHIAFIGTVRRIKTSNDWLAAGAREELRHLAHTLVTSIHDLLSQGSIGRQVLDATVFVAALSRRVVGLRRLFEVDFKVNIGADRKLSRRIHQWAQQQGLTGFVDDLYESLAAQLAYRLAGQALFYESFRRLRKDLPELRINLANPILPQVRGFWDAVRSVDYEALFEPSPLEEIPLSNQSVSAIAALINNLAVYDWDTVGVDVLGSIFEEMIPGPERMLLGQYYTRPALVDLILSMTMGGPTDLILDPAVGTGTFLYRAHDRITRTSAIKHESILASLWGFDISAFPAELAVINLSRLDLTSQNNFPRIAVRDFFTLKPGMSIPFPPAKLLPKAPTRVEFPIPAFDAIVGNPPYIRSQHLDDLDSAYKRRLEGVVLRAKVGEPPDYEAPKFDAFAYFLVHAAAFLKAGGRLGFVTSAAWLTAKYGAALQKYLLDHFQPIAVLWSSVEPFFPTVEVDTVVLILERLSEEQERATRGSIRFITLLKPLNALVPDHQTRDYWLRVDQFLGQLEAASTGSYDGYNVTCVDGDLELSLLKQAPKIPRNWARHLRATPIYHDLFGND